MKNDQFDDLKQFIDSRISQSETRLEAKIEKLDQKIDNKIDGLRQEMLDGFAGVGEAIKEIHDRMDKRDKVVNRRLSRLEKQIFR